MKIQGINNNQNNVSHRAYFKPNETFNAIYGKYGKTLSKESIAKLKSLPEHKLEMLGVKYFEGVTHFDIFNTYTKKTATYGVHSKTPLESLIDVLSSKSNADFFTEEALISMNYLSLTMPTLFKTK